MNTTKRTHITVEKREVWVVRQGRKIATAWCEACAETVEMATADQAAALAHVSTRAIYRQVENGQIHFTETADGQLFVCLNSLSK
ncbi:MAG: hypothetical protein ABI977_21095 [Acidobacteriota bacterium]